MSRRTDESTLADRAAAVEGRRVSHADDGSADLAAELAQMGLSPRAAWYSSAVLYGVGGLLVTGLHVIDASLVPRDVFYIGYVAMAIGALCLLAGVRLVDS